MAKKGGNNRGAYSAATISRATIGERNGKPLISADATFTVYLPNDVPSHEYDNLYKTEQDSLRILGNAAGATSFRMNELVANAENAEAARAIFDSQVRDVFRSEKDKAGGSMADLIGTHRE